MEIHQERYPAYLIASLVLGVLLGLIYDLLHDPKGQGAEKEGTRAVNLLLNAFADLAFCLIAACGVALVAYATNRGRVRWFALAATLGGLLLYRHTVGRAVRALQRALARALALALHHTVGRWYVALKQLAARRRAKRITSITLRRALFELARGEWNDTR